MDDCRWWTVTRDVTAGVARRLPSALIGTAMLVTFAGILGPTWGAAVALGWLAGGALVLTRPGERLAATTVMRYRPAPKSWLAADVRQLAPRRRIDVYVAPKATGVFALGGHTVAIGERSVDAGTRTAALQAAARSAVAELRAGRTRPELAMGWWSGPWLFAKLTAGAFLPPRWYPFFRLFGSVMVGMSVVTCLGHGQPVAAGLGVCLLADLALDYLGRRRAGAVARRRTVPSLACA